MPTDATSPVPPAAAVPSATDVPEPLRAKIGAQGVSSTATFEHLLGAGKNLWADDDEFDRFLAITRATRAERD